MTHSLFYDRRYENIYWQIKRFSFQVKCLAFSSKWVRIQVQLRRNFLVHKVEKGKLKKMLLRVKTRNLLSYFAQQVIFSHFSYDSSCGSKGWALLFKAKNHQELSPQLNRWNAKGASFPKGRIFSSCTRAPSSQETALCTGFIWSWQYSISGKHQFNRIQQSFEIFAIDFFYLI